MKFRKHRQPPCGRSTPETSTQLAAAALAERIRELKNTIRLSMGSGAIRLLQDQLDLLLDLQRLRDALKISLSAMYTAYDQPIPITSDATLALMEGIRTTDSVLASSNASILKMKRETV